MDPLSIFAATASAIQLVSTICDLGARILAKSEDKKQLELLCQDAKKYHLDLGGWAETFEDPVKTECHNLRELLGLVIKEIETSGGKKWYTKVAEAMKLTLPEYERKIRAAFERFKVAMCMAAENR